MKPRNWKLYTFPTHSKYRYRVLTNICMYVYIVECLWFFLFINVRKLLICNEFAIKRNYFVKALKIDQLKMQTITQQIVCVCVCVLHSCIAYGLRKRKSHNNTQHKFLAAVKHTYLHITRLPCCSNAKWEIFFSLLHTSLLHFNPMTLHAWFVTLKYFSIYFLAFFYNFTA